MGINKHQREIRERTIQLWIQQAPYRELRVQLKDFIRESMKLTYNGAMQQAEGLENALDEIVKVGVGTALMTGIQEPLLIPISDGIEALRKFRGEK